MPGIREDDGRDLRVSYHVDRGHEARTDNFLEPDVGGGNHLDRSDFWSSTRVHRLDGFGARNDDDENDYAPKDIFGRGDYVGRGPAGYVRSSERILDDICSRFIKSHDLDATHISVDVIGDEVHLTGVVPDRRSKRLAEDLAADVPGVKDVINQLTVRQS